MSGTTPPSVPTSQSITTTSTKRSGTSRKPLETDWSRGSWPPPRSSRARPRRDEALRHGAGGARLLQVEARRFGGLGDQAHVLGRVSELEARRITVRLHVGALGANGGSDRRLGEHVEHGGAVETDRRRQREGLAEGDDRGGPRSPPGHCLARARRRRRRRPAAGPPPSERLSDRSWTSR